jgi:hypothetical protein
LRQAVAAPDLHSLRREIQQGNLDLVSRPAIVRIDNADAVGDHQPALERRAAAREDPQELSSRHFDHQPCRHERHLAWFNEDIGGRRQIECRRLGALVTRQRH